MNLKVETKDYDRLIVSDEEGKQLSSEDTPNYTSRKVFMFDEFVIKFESSKGQNKRELDFYINVLEKEDEQYFPILLDYFEHEGKYVIVQERVKDCKILASPEQKEKFREVLDKYKITDVWEGKNVSFSDGKIKIYDIGYHGKGINTLAW